MGTPVCPHCKKGVADVLPPDHLLRGGRYRIEKALGKGGFGITYRAWDTEFERNVAIKEYFPSSFAHRDPNSGSLTVTSDDVSGIEKGLESFRREGRHLARVEHLNIPKVYDRFDENNTSYMVMEFLEGRSLKQVMAGKPLPPDQIAHIMDSLVSALAETHAQGIHHLDIKPDNVIVQTNGRVVLIDFGAARQGTSFGDTSIAALTPAYAPLELQARQNYGPETDIFELGMLLHQMLTGSLPPSANERLISKQDWEPEGIDEPWRTLVSEATLLRYEDRPKDVRAWWFRTEPDVNGVMNPNPLAGVDPGPASAGGSGPVTGSTRNTGPWTRTPITTGARVGAGVATQQNTTPGVETVMAPPDQRRTPSSGALIGIGAGVIAVAGAAAFFAFAKPQNAGAGGAQPTPAASASATPKPAQDIPAATKELQTALNKINSASVAEIPKIAKAAQAALEKGAEVNAMSKDGTAPLHVAAALGLTDLAQDLILRGASINVRDSNNRTPLHMAAAGDSPEMVTILLKHGASTDLEDIDGSTPLKLAETLNQGPKKAEIIKILKAAGAKGQ